jgi:hypothetical protein
MKGELRPPKGFSAKARATWREVLQRYELDPVGRVFLPRWLEADDLADRLHAAALAAGLTATREGRAALAAYRDASQTALKYAKALGLDKTAQGTPRRPGRPSDEAWSPMRHRERDRVTGQPLRPPGVA